MGISQKTLNVVCREPYRLFFPLGIWMGIVGVSPWFLYAFGLSETYSAFFHSSVQMLVYINCFVIGFLMTFIPRFTGTSYATKAEVFSFLFLLFGIAIFLRKEQWILAEGFYILWLLLLVLFVMRRVKRKRQTEASSKPPHELVWVPCAVLHGIVGTFLLMMGQLKFLSNWSIKIGKPMMEQGFLLCVVIGIGSFLLPRIMRTYVTRQGIDESAKPCCQMKIQAKKTKNMVFVHAANALGILVSFLLEGFGFISMAYGLRALAATCAFAVTRSLFWPREKAFYVKLAYAAVWMVVIGLWLAAFFSEYHVAMLHITFIGGFSLLTFAIATMVVMSHAGEAKKLNTFLWALWIVAAGIVLAVLKRAMVITFPDFYFKFLGLSSAAWITAAAGWMIFILPRLFKVPSEDTFGGMHEKAKNL